MKLLVTGASGLLGLNLSLAADWASYQFVGVDGISWQALLSRLVKADLLEPGAALER